jgi:penicillin-binding protein 2
MTSNPLQVLRFTAAIANGGRLLKPKVVLEVRDAQGAVVTPFSAESAPLPASAENLRLLREGMRLAVTEGTARSAALPDIAVAGKTGTAEFGQAIGSRGGQSTYQEHGWFVGFAPYDNPEIAVVVFHERGQGAGTASPAAGEILKAYFSGKRQATEHGR